jgi:hypothetical protein
MKGYEGLRVKESDSEFGVQSYACDRIRDSVSRQKVFMGKLWRFLELINNWSSSKVWHVLVLDYLARFRLFGHTKVWHVLDYLAIQKFGTFQTICPYKTGYRRSGVARAADFFSTKGDRLSHCAKSAPSTHKKIPPLVQSIKEITARDQTDDPWVNFQSLSNFSRGGWRTESRIRS